MNTINTTPDEPGRLDGLINGLVILLFITIFICILATMGMTLFAQGLCGSQAASGIGRLIQVVCWFDPVFTIYNLLLLLVMVMLVPLITYFYVRSMGDRKRQVLTDQLREIEGSAQLIDNTLNKTFKTSHYAGSMTMLSIVIFLGGMIILLLKPMAGDGSAGAGGFGVDYSKGANFLMLGTYMEYFVAGKDDYMHALLGTLTAFQFGFLGAYVYFITHLVRSYFTLDLSPNVYISCSVRIMMGAVLSLILSFFIINELPEFTGGREPVTAAATSLVTAAQDVQPGAQADDEDPGGDLSDLYFYLPALSFFIGFFPLRGLLLLEHLAGSLLGKLPIKYHSTSLTELTGMSYQHEIRLRREGFDNVENFVNAELVDLTLRTGFAYRQLHDWRSQARLITLLGEDYRRFRQATGIENVDQLKMNTGLFEPGYAASELNILVDEGLFHKSRIILNSIEQGG